MSNENNFIKENDNLVIYIRTKDNILGLMSIDIT